MELPTYIPKKGLLKLFFAHASEEEKGETLGDERSAWQQRLSDEP